MRSLVCDPVSAGEGFARLDGGKAPTGLVGILRYLQARNDEGQPARRRPVVAEAACRDFGQFGRRLGIEQFRAERIMLAVVAAEMLERRGRGAGLNGEARLVLVAEILGQAGLFGAQQVGDGDFQRVTNIRAKHQRPGALAVLQPRLARRESFGATPPKPAGDGRIEPLGARQLGTLIGGIVPDGRDRVLRRHDVAAQGENHPERIERAEPVVDDGLVEGGDICANDPWTGCCNVRTGSLCSSLP